MIKCIVTDLDGTLLNERIEIQPSDITALLSAAQAGFELCFATGRAYGEIQQIMQKVGVSGYAVSQNGAWTYTKDGALLHAATFAAETAQQIIDILSSYDVVTLLCDADRYYIAEKTDRSREYVERLIIPCEQVGPLREAVGGRIQTSKINAFGKPERLKEATDAIAHALSDVVDTYIVNEDCLDIMPTGVTKGKGLSQLLDHIGMQVDEMACIGDSYNDVPMFALTPHSFAMANGPEDVRKKAAHTVASVAEAVERIVDQCRAR
ncbi:Cof-type HAD-IIB family hydrolase [Numidum massiliense]|uniref:Cof-type HAD-IIB family hydrolase n=1 Tax=Numidum massiliense TaxID=1522315 RepID=UPI0006D572ED|nr:Cof-type HAD-IIB family hydrolase [Numidum massiliense]